MSREILVKHVNTMEGFKELKSEWGTLLNKSLPNDAFLSWEWLYTWWETYGSTNSLWLITVWSADELVGIAPLMLDKRGKGIFTLRILCNIGTPGNDVGGLIVKDGEKQIIDVLFRYVMEHKSEWDILEFNEIFQKDNEAMEFSQTFSQDQYAILQETKKHYYIPLTGDWESYFSSLSKKFRYNLRRAEKLAKENGSLNFDHYLGDETNWKIFQKVIEINQYSHHPRLYLSQKEQSFIKRLVEQMAEQKWLKVYILSIDNQPVAYEYGFICAGRFEAWRAGYDTRINPAISIGKLLSMMIIKNCAKNGCVEIDFLRGDEAYKTEWQPETRNFISTRIFQKKKLPSTLAYFWLNKIKPLIKQDRN